MPRPIRALIHPQALSANLAAIRRCAPAARVWSVVKANAYGHGIEQVFQALASTDGFALLDLDEARRVRALGWRGPILLLEGVFHAADLQAVEEHELTIVVHCAEQVRMLELARPARPIDVYLKVNSGMNRLGFAPGQYARVWHTLRNLAQVGRIIHMSHFANADNARGIRANLERFGQATEGLPGEVSLANSAATLWHSVSHRDWVRPGIVLYGASPSGQTEDIAGFALQPAMTLQSALIAVQELQAGEQVGYGSMFTAEQACRVGIVACGYADGYPRHAPCAYPPAAGGSDQRAVVLIAGRRLPIAGRVSMDMLAVELPLDLPVQVGTPVTLWGRGLPIDDVAASAGTIGYELMCAVTRRVPVISDDSSV